MTDKNLTSPIPKDTLVVHNLQIENINLLLNNTELQELKQLFSTKKQGYHISESINIMNLNFTNFLN